MKMNYEGTKRKTLAAAIAEITGEKAVYKFTPTYAYESGDLVGKDDARLADLLQALAEKGFATDNESQEGAEANDDDNAGLTVTVPATAATVSNLKNLLTAKGTLIKKALGTQDIGINADDNTISFPWFHLMPAPDEVKAYTEFIAALCRMSKELKRISATERSVENEKYAFRCFLLRLGFIGEEYKTSRRILLRNLSGNSAWRKGAPEKEAADD